MNSCWKSCFLVSSIAQVISQRVLDTYASRIPLHQIISLIDEVMRNKEKEGKKAQSDYSLIEFVQHAEFKLVSTYEGCQKATSECKPLANSREFRSWRPKTKQVLSRLESAHVDLFISNELQLAKSYNP